METQDSQKVETQHRQKVVKHVESWLSDIVIELNLCPFAKREYLSKRIRFQCSPARSEQELLQDLVVELALLKKTPEVETTLLIHPQVLQDFDQYNQFLGFAEQVIEQMNMQGVYQIASFHPDYQFAGTQINDAENYTNRAPYPLLHILREASLEKAIEAHSNTEQIPEVNIALMNKLGAKEMAQRLENIVKN